MMMNLRIENDGGQPLYVKIADAIRAEIDAGRLSEGDALPPIRVMAKQCGVSEMPVKQAVRVLVQEEALVSTRGRGTFVRKRSDDGFVPQSDRRSESGRSKIVVIFQHGLRAFAGHLAPYIEEIEQALEKIHFTMAYAPSSIESCLRFVESHKDDIAGVIALHTGAGLLAAKVPKPSGFPILGAVSPREVFDTSVLTDVLSIDSRGAIHTATSYLLSLGHKRIAFLHYGLKHLEPKLRLDMEDRLSGFKEALSDGGVEFREEFLTNGRLSMAESKLATRQLFGLPEPPTAIVCANDVSAYGAMSAVSEAGLRIPEDVSIIGHYDWEMSQYMDPPLTSVGYKEDENQGELMARLLVERLANPMKPPTHIHLEPVLQVRGSCAPVAQFRRR